MHDKFFLYLMPQENWVLKYRNTKMNSGQPVTPMFSCPNENGLKSPVGSFQLPLQPQLQKEQQQQPEKLQQLQQQDQKQQEEDSRSSEFVWRTEKSKRKRSPGTILPHQKQSKISDYWLGAPTNNRFENLQDKDEMDQDEEPQKQVKPPPIFIEGVSNYAPLQELLNSIAANHYDAKIISSTRVKVQPWTIEIYREIIKKLAEKETQFHTYQMKSERAFRVVLKNVHPSTDPEEIKESLKVKGHDVRFIHNIRHRGNKLPLPKFFVDLEPKSNNKDIYKIELLMNLKVAFEPPHQKREIPQCTNCQRYGHTKRFCHNIPRCVKCTDYHGTASCSRRERDNNVKCVLCDGNHPANYRGCQVHKELQAKKFPVLRSKKPASDVPMPTQFVRSNISYADIARGKSEQTQHENNLNQQIPNQQSDMLELKQMMKGLMEQMGTMLNLLTTLVAKMK